MRITFHGAARQVTGSAHLLEIGGRRLLLDCGLFDSDRLNPESPNRRFDFDPRSLDAVIVSHAHNDHIGRLPYLARLGYEGTIFATPATGDVMSIMLRDSAKIQMHDAREAGLAAGPLFEQADVDRVAQSLVRLPYESPTEVLPQVTLTFKDAGHILGSAVVQIDFRESGSSRRFVFTGDLGRRNTGLMPDPSVPTDVDVLVSESTYGARSLDPYAVMLKQLHAIVARAIRLHSKIVIPAFSLGRTQQMVYCLQDLFSNRGASPVPVYVDSPLGARLTETYRDHPRAFTPSARGLMGRDERYFGADFVRYCTSYEESRRLNHLDGPLVIISSSGMCEGGRVKHHLRRTVEDPDNAVVIVSYQAEGTLGRKIAKGTPEIEIMGYPLQLNAAVYVLDGFSGHADRGDLAWWYETTGGGIEQAFLVHGEPEGMEGIRPTLQQFVEGDVVLPQLGDSFVV